MASSDPDDNIKRKYELLSNILIDNWRSVYLTTDFKLLLDANKMMNIHANDIKTILNTAEVSESELAMVMNEKVELNQKKANIKFQAKLDEDTPTPSQLSQLQQVKTALTEEKAHIVKEVFELKGKSDK